MEQNQEPKIKVLVVEDDRLLSKMYTEKFNLEGFDTSIAYDGEEALKMAQEEKFDVILLDLMLPKMSGLDMLQEFLHANNGQSAPVIALTNLVDPKERQRAFELGVKDYLVKAMQTPEEVVQIIKHHAKNQPETPDGSNAQSE